jgi:SAM-dependent methyltransferase
MDLDAFLELLTPRGQKALDEATRLTAGGADPVAAVTALRRTYDPVTASAALTQAALRDRAAAKFGPSAAGMYFTPDGLEQASRPEVAAHRAARVAGGPAGTGGGMRVADVCCGIGGDLIALAGRGCEVDGVDLDPLTVAVARANAEALGLSRVRIRADDASAVDPGGYDLVFADPARRRPGGSGTARRVFDPMAYSPPWPKVLEIARRARAACVKAAPGLPHEFVPEGAEAEWVSFRGEVKEVAIWLPPPVPLGAPGGAHEPGGFTRRATLLPGGETLAAVSASPAEAGPVARYLYEPDGAAIRAGLVAEVATMVRGHLLDPHIAYITSDRQVSTPWATRYEICDVVPFSGKRLRAVLRERRVGELTIKKRGSAVDVERLHRSMRLSGDKSAIVALTRISTKPYALILEKQS